MHTGDDFWCTDPSGDPNGTFWLQGCHMVHCAYNSLWMGNFIHPDWDMFQSTHPCAEFHAASRAISGGPIYVSDAVGKHNFELLKSLVLPDGSVLRCQYYALPARDCLFEDPLHDGKTLLKIWNLNKVRHPFPSPISSFKIVPKTYILVFNTILSLITYYIRSIIFLFFFSHFVLIVLCL
jgi:hypothetical protein